MDNVRALAGRNDGLIVDGDGVGADGCDLALAPDDAQGLRLAAAGVVVRDVDQHAWGSGDGVPLALLVFAEHQGLVAQARVREGLCELAL